MATRRFQSRARRPKAGRGAKKSQGPLKPALLWVGTLFLTVWTAWVVLFPGRSGVLGGHLAGGLFGLLGRAAYGVPPLLAYTLFAYFRPTKKLAPTLFASGALLCLFSGSALLSLAAGLAADAGWGGLAGDAAADGLSRILGRPGAFLAALSFLVLGTHLAFEFSWRALLSAAAESLREDLEVWRESRRELRESAKKAAKEGPKIELPVPAAAAAAPAPARLPEPEPLPEEPVILGSEPEKPKKRKPKPEPAPAKAGGPAKPYEIPGLELLDPGDPTKGGRPTDEQLKGAAAVLERTLANFSIQCRVVGISPGPVITRYELAPAPGVKVSSITSLANDLALALKARSIRVIAPIPGKAAVGIEVPNPRPAMVTLREILESPDYQGRHTLPFCLGRAAEGDPIVADISKMPHVLVAGATNSGKSVLVHDLILSLLYRMRPDELKLLMIDPKRLELTFYEGIPHLYDPRLPDTDVRVLTDPKEAAKSLKKLVRLMEIRYEKFSKYGVRNIEGYNEEADKRGEEREFYIVVVIDELADLMLTSAETVEDSIQRLAQMARAVGIHLVLATQRPSVDVLTGVIKANLPTRIALQVISKVDSRVILDHLGADALMGRGDLLYLASGAQKPVRAQAPYVSEEEIRKVVAHLREQGPPCYPPMEVPEVASVLSDDGRGASLTEIVAALRLVQERKRVSQDLLKAHFGSSAKATDLLSLLEVKGFIYKPDGTNRWEIGYDKIEDFLRAVASNLGPAETP